MVTILPDLASLANDHGVLCDACGSADAAEEEAKQAQEREQRRRAAAYAAMCPPCFADTDVSRLPCPRRSAEAQVWQLRPQGLNLWGIPNTGKSRTASLIVRRELMAGRSVIALGPGDFRRECEARSFKRGAWLKRLAEVDLLYIDDVDKMNLTREMEKDLFAVLNDRMGHKPLLITGNSHGEELKLQFKCGEALVRRIRDFCYSLHFGRADMRFS